MITLSELAREKIRAYIKNSGISHRAMAQKAGITDTVLRGVDKLNWNPLSETLAKLERAVERVNGNEPSE